MTTSRRGHAQTLNAEAEGKAATEAHSSSDRERAADDDEAVRIGDHLDGRTVAVAESCTGGLVARALAAAPGSGEWFRGALVAYQRDVKFELLGVTPGPVVSTRAASEMAIGVAALLHADVTVAAGAAGPEPHDGAEPGTVIIAVVADERATVREYRFDGEPAAVRRAACAQAIRDLELAVARRE